MFLTELKRKPDAGERSGMKMDMTKKMMVLGQKTELLGKWKNKWNLMWQWCQNSQGPQKATPINVQGLQDAITFTV